MSNFNTVIAEKTRDLIAPISDYSLYLCHDGVGAILTDSSLTTELLGDLTINGTTTNIWDTQSNIAPAGDQAMQDNDAAAQASGVITTANQIIFFIDFFATGAPTTQNMLMMYGRSGGGGKHAIKFSIETTGRFQVQHVDTTGATQSSNTGTYGDVCDSTRHSLVAVVDNINGVIITYVDGVLQGASVLENKGNTVDSRGWCLFANMTGDASRNNYYGAGGIVGTYCNRIGLMRTSTNQSANLGAIVTGLSNITHELPWSMDGI